MSFDAMLWRNNLSYLYLYAKSPLKSTTVICLVRESRINIWKVTRQWVAVFPEIPATAVNDGNQRVAWNTKPFPVTVIGHQFAVQIVLKSFQVLLWSRDGLLLTVSESLFLGCTKHNKVRWPKTGQSVAFEPKRTWTGRQRRLNRSKMTHSVISGPSVTAVRKAYSITSSAATSRVCGTVNPSALAVLRLMTSSNLVGCCTGRSPGFSPLRMRST
jgi:hypothetical protein